MVGHDHNANPRLLLIPPKTNPSWKTPVGVLEESQVMRLFSLLAAGGLGCLSLLALGCEKQDPIRTYQVPKEPAHVHRDRIEWKAPADWVEGPGDEQTHTYAGFTVKDTPPPLEMTVTTLPREAPQAADVTANV